MEGKRKEISDKTLLEVPFTLYFGGYKLLMEDIYKKSNKFQNNLEGYTIGNNFFSVKFSNKNEYECEMSIYHGDSFEYSCDLLYEPLTLNLRELNLSLKEILLYSVIQIKKLIHYYNSDYIFLDKDKNILKENSDYKYLKIIYIKKKEEYSLNDKKFLDTREKASNFFKNFETITKNEIIDIDPLLLSFNFFNIFSECLENKSFKFILNKERKKFLEDIIKFINSSKKFLWIIGSDGIGKTISLMYFSTVYDNNVLYINLKFLQNHTDKIKEILRNDLIKLFYLRKNNQTEKEFKDTQNNLDYMFKKIFNLSQNDNKLEPIYKFWIYLENALENIDLNFSYKSIIIILDQYKDISWNDYDYSYLNNFINYIYTKNYKLIISTSINNRNIQSNFYNNIEYFNFNLNDKNEGDESDSDNMEEIKDDFDIKQECNFYQNILRKKEQSKIIENKNKESNPIYSKFCLNNQYKDYTLKIYISSLISGKNLVKNFKEEEINCFKNFNFNLKYINKFIKFKADFKNKKKSTNTIDTNNTREEENNNIDINPKNNNEIINMISDEKEDKKLNQTEEDVSEIIKEFYEMCHNHIQIKIKGFYSMFENENVTMEEYIRLKELRDIIFTKELFTLEGLRRKIKYYPGKYLNIIPKKIADIDSPSNLEYQAFQIKYSNMFFKLAMDNILNLLDGEIKALNKPVKGSGGGINFESNVINSILFSNEHIFGQLNYNKRNVFSLVGKTENSKKTVEKHRKEEKNNKLFKFYNINEYSEEIDDIDFEIGSNKIKLTENLYLIAQISKTGRSFDFAILKKSIDSEEWFLYLFQASINKESELKSKDFYIKDSIKSESYLNSLYKITIKKTYLIFVIPFNDFDNSFAIKLDEREIYYIYFKTCQFYDKYDNIISNINFIGAEITNKQKKNIDKDQINIEKSLNALKLAVNEFLKRKRERDLSDYYAKNLSKIKGRGIKLKIPVEMKNKIFEAIYKNIFGNKYELFFIGNCKIKKIKDTYDKNTLLIFFKLQNNHYFYFGNYYQLIDDSFIKISQMPKEQGTTSKKKYKKNIIDLKEIDDKIDLCFCYRILEEKNK